MMSQEENALRFKNFLIILKYNLTSLVLLAISELSVFCILSHDVVLPRNLIAILSKLNGIAFNVTYFSAVYGKNVDVLLSCYVVIVVVFAIDVIISCYIVRFPFNGLMFSKRDSILVAAAIMYISYIVFFNTNFHYIKYSLLSIYIHPALLSGLSSMTGVAVSSLRR